MSRGFPLQGSDPLAERTPAVNGSARALDQKVTVIGAGIAGIAAAVGLAERGVHVTLVEPHEQSGGRVRAWSAETPAGDVTMSRGFHAFFRQYYNLRALFTRIGPINTVLRPVDDYPVIRSNGDADSFRKIPKRPPWNFIGFVLQSPTFEARDLVRVDLDRALSLLDVSFPQTFHDLDGVSAQEFLDALHFPDRARHLALQVFARSFFADPAEFSAGELVGMFHTYFLGSAEGLLFDVPRDDFDTSLWAPLERYLAGLGATRIVGSASDVTRDGDTVITTLDDGTQLRSDGVVIAAGPRATRELIERSTSLGTVSVSDQQTDTTWRERMAQQRNAPPFAVWRLWFDRPARPERPAFLGTTGYGVLDNVSVLERFEKGAAAWASARQGSVIELHAYALLDHDGSAAAEEAVKDELRRELVRVYPEFADAEVLHDEFIIDDDCALIDTRPYADRPTVATPDPLVKLAGDHVRCDTPVALMERAATTGWMAANELLEGWGVTGHDLWSVPSKARHAWPASARKFIAKRNST